MASLFLKSFHRYGKLTFEIELMKIYGLLPASLSHQSRTSIVALHSLLHVPCRHAALLNPNSAAKQPQTKSMRQKLTRKERFAHKFSDI